MRIMSVERSIGTRRGAAVASRPMTMGAPRSFGGGEKAMTNFAKYMSNSDRAIRPSEARTFRSAQNVTPRGPYIDTAVRSFRTKELTLRPLSRINTTTALSIRPEQRIQMVTRPRVTMIRPVMTERRMMQQPTHRINFAEAKSRRSMIDNKTVTFSDLRYAKTFPMGNKDLYFNSKTQAKEQTLFSKTLASNRAEQYISRPVVKPMRLITPTLQLSELNQPLQPSLKNKPDVILSKMTHRTEQVVSHSIPVSFKQVKENSKPVLSNVNLKIAEKAPFIPSSKEKIQNELAHTNVSVTNLARKQAEKQIDHMMLHQVKAQLKDITATPVVVHEPASNFLRSTPEKPKTSNKRALMLLAKVGKVEENEKKTPLSQEKQTASRKFLMRIFQKIELEKQKRKERKEKMQLRNTKKLYLIHDRKTMQNRENIIQFAINKVAKKNKITGQTTVDMQDVANQLPVIPSKKLISRIRFQWLAFLFTGLSLDGTWDTIRTQAGRLHRMDPTRAAQAANHIVSINPAVEQSETITAPPATKSQVGNVFGVSLAA